MTRVAIIGAGLAGLVAARALTNHATVTLFEKSRGVGGRMATRKATVNGRALQFDHGAQFFTARSDAFIEFLRPLTEEGTVASWNGGFAELKREKVRRTWTWGDTKPHFVGVPGMNAVGKALAAGLDVRLRQNVAAISKQGREWRLESNEGLGLGKFDWVVLTAPADQTAALLPASSELFASTQVEMQPCFALMLGFEEPLPLAWQAARVLDADISWISLDSSKPGRPDGCRLVVHSTNAWAAANMEIAPATAREHLLAEVASVVGQSVHHAAHIDLHRWRYANLGRRKDEPSLVDSRNRLAVAGDWLVHGRIEAAFESAQRMLGEMLPHLRD